MATKAATKATAAIDPALRDATPVNCEPVGDVEDGETVGTMGEPVGAEGTTGTPVAVLPGAVPVPVPVPVGYMPVTKPVEPPNTPVE